MGNTLKTKWLLLLIMVACTACQEQAQKQEVVQSPNIVYILTDQWRSSALGYSGDPNVQTPHLDQFAKEAVNFSNAVTVTPVCTPHRAALMTGRYPTTTGMFLNDLYLPTEENCMAEIFKTKGYQTGFLGKWHLDGHGRLNNVEPERRQGFDYWKALECSHNYNKMPYYDNDDPEIKYWETYSPNALAQDANSFIREKSNTAHPFLLVVSMATPHFPHDSAPEEYKALYPPSSLILNPNVPEENQPATRRELQGYYAHCTATDAAIGQIIQQIKELDILDNTIIVFTADHGEIMGAHGIPHFTKQLVWDESIKVPFLIHYPGIEDNKGAVVNAPINTPDILPSLLGLANFEIPESIEGEDLSDLIKAPDPEVDRAALVMNICPFTREYKFPEYRAVRTKQYTYTRTLDGPNALFDNLQDPFQMDNLINQADYTALQQELDQKLNSALQRIGDDFQPRDYYLQKWNVKLDPSNNAINYKDFLKGEGIVQSPTLK